ncbi:RNI-like protein [Xylona heveae TC161]|uniref:RNI-like protein n=1 Tax=Xylona heveae (strain CBS 132557 / TC161) TaxID=1328760 RepID=A0A164ZXL8_XYLHT|nr:RNI-like protein [Xylona heveae TC161]KZF19664.1 RNI-like protein [Xylona heveae TC161]
MESVHGIDVSWLHHSPKATATTSEPTAAPGSNGSTQKGSGAPANGLNGQSHSSAPSTPTEASKPHLPWRSTLLSRSNSEKHSTAASPSETLQSAQAEPQKPLQRRNSWISSISSKFSSPQSHNSNSANGTNVTKTLPAESPKVSTSPNNPPDINPFGAPVSPSAATAKGEDMTPYVPQPPKTGHPSFLTNALRRLSTGGQTSGSCKAPSNGGVCKRRVLNVDVNRDRCKIQELEPSKLRRVAFCVDVEIAGASRYTDENDQVVEVKKKKQKDRKMKEKSEGEALKHPEAVVVEKEELGVVRATGEPVGEENGSPPKSSGEPEKQPEPNRKKEKKKRSEEERKARRERKRRQAEANGTIPVEFTRDGNRRPSNPKGSGSKMQDRPTIDPLRIYRRCCQLRESGILKKVTEQLSSPSACAAATPGVVSCLDLSDCHLQLSDIITLGDWLAIVPVKKLMLENCALGDEAVRIILAGLLAVKSTSRDQTRQPSGPAEYQDHKHEETHGMIEKMSLKHNVNIGSEGWRHIGLFLNMSRSIKAIDVSMNPFPRMCQSCGSGPLFKGSGKKSPPEDMAALFSKAISERLAGPQLEELIMDECGLNTDQLGKIADAVIQTGIRRLGVASNHLTTEGLDHILRYVRSGKCEGLDLGGNDLSEQLHLLSEALDDKIPLYALSLADCNLSPSSLSVVMPAFVSLPNLRFIDLSHNRKLFATQPDALSLLRKYIPKLSHLKRLHLVDVSLTPEHAIALVEVLPENGSLAHLNILENPAITAVATAKDEVGQEEACALYASLMAATRVSKTIICIDVDVPGPETSEVVKALAKQVVAYCLLNMERGPVAEAIDTSSVVSHEHHENEKVSHVPEVLLQLVGHVEGYSENHDDDDAAPDNDYVLGGTGLVKALGVCLGNKSLDSPHLQPSTPSEPGSSPLAVIHGRGRAKNMSKNLLESARKIRVRLQPALAREARAEDDMNYKRLLFLDSTLERMIQRFEDEYPECRVRQPGAAPSQQPSVEASSDTNSIEEVSLNGGDQQTADSSALLSESGLVGDDVEAEGEGEGEGEYHVGLPRRASDVSLASRALLEEEGRMHRFGQQVRRDILRPETLDHAHGTTGEEQESDHLKVLRQKLEALDGEEIRNKVFEAGGPAAVLRELGATAEQLKTLEHDDPEAFRSFREAQLTAQANVEALRSAQTS